MTFTESEYLLQRNRAKVHWQNRAFIRRHAPGVFESDGIKDAVDSPPVKKYLATILHDVHGPILDVGAGAFSHFFYPEEKRVIAYDLAHDNLVLGQYGVLNGNYQESIVGDAEDALPFPRASCGAVISKQVYGYLVDPSVFLSESMRILQPGGNIVIMDLVGNVAGWAYRMTDFSLSVVGERLAEEGFAQVQTTWLWKEPVRLYREDIQETVSVRLAAVSAEKPFLT